MADGAKERLAKGNLGPHFIYSYQFTIGYLGIILLNHQNCIGTQRENKLYNKM